MDGGEGRGGGGGEDFGNEKEREEGKIGRKTM